MANQNRSDKVFLCHAGEDKRYVQKIYKKLKADGFALWIDKEDLLPGQLWKEEIPRVIHSFSSPFALTIVKYRTDSR